MNIEDIIKSFEEIKTEFRRPPITGPTIIQEGTAFFNYLKRKIGINPDFVKYLSETGKSLETIVKGLFEHEFGHYIFPGNLSMNIFLSYTANKHFKENAMEIHALYADLINNAVLVNYGNGENLKKVLEADFRMGQVGSTNAAIFLAYKDMFDLDINIDLNQFENVEEIKRAVETIKGLSMNPKEDYGLHYSQIISFGEALEPLLKRDKEEFGSNIKISFDDNGFLTKDNIKDMDLESQQKVREAVEILAKDLPRKMYEDIKRELGLSNHKQEQSTGIGSGSLETKIADKETVSYYKTLAKAFGIYIRPKRGLTIESQDIPMRINAFSPSNPISRIKLTHSGGKIIPGLSKAIEDEDTPEIAERDKIPNLVIYKDVSGSMDDPRKTKDYPTIAATMLTLSYLRSGANVGICLFDDGSDELYTTRDEDKLLAVVCGYKGGGTSIDIEKLKKDVEAQKLLMFEIDEDELKKNPLFKAYIKKNARIGKLEKSVVDADLVIITDGGINNIDEVVSFVKENPNYNPIIIHTGGYNLDIRGYDNKTSGVYEGIKIWKIKTEEDIVNVTKKIMKETLLSEFHQSG